MWTTRLVDVRFGSKADVARCQADFRFTPESGHSLSELGCLLCAKSGHSAVRRNTPAPLAKAHSAFPDRVAGVAHRLARTPRVAARPRTGRAWSGCHSARSAA